MIQVSEVWHVSINLYKFLMFLKIGCHTIDYSVCTLVSLDALGFYEFASQVYRVGCTECNGTGFGGVACFN